MKIHKLCLLRTSQFDSGTLAPNSIQVVTKIAKTVVPSHRFQFVPLSFERNLVVPCCTILEAGQMGQLKGLIPSWLYECFC